MKRTKIKRLVKDFRYTFSLLFLSSLFFIDRVFSEDSYLVKLSLYILPLYFLLNFLLKINKLPTRVLILIVLLFSYCLVYSTISGDLEHGFTVVCTISALSVLINNGYHSNHIYYGSFFAGLFFMSILILFYKGYISGNPNSISEFVSPGFYFMLISYYLGTVLNKRFNIVVIFFILFYFYLLFDIASRNIVMTLLFAVFLLIFFKNIIKNKLVFRIIYLTPFLLSAIIPNVYRVISTTSFGVLMEDASNLLFHDVDIFNGRGQIWDSAFNLINGRILFGTGESLYYYMYAHNMYLSVVYMYGVIGYMLFVIFISSILECVHRRSRDDIIAMTCLISFISITYSQIFENSLFASDQLYYFPYLFLSLALLRSIKKINNNTLYSVPLINR